VKEHESLGRVAADTAPRPKVKEARVYFIMNDGIDEK
jgi:hypothetical protein